jgi:hypothetical protein
MADIAAAVAAEFPAAHVPDVARKLLLTAATRGNEAAVQALASCAPVQQCLDAGTLESVLEQSIKGECGCFEMMCNLPAASQLDSAAVARLLQAALQLGRQGFVKRLLRGTAAEQFRADIVVQSLHALLNSTTIHPNRFAAKLCMLPAAHQLGSSVVEQLLLAAIEGSNRGNIDNGLEALCGLPAATQLGSGSVTRLLQAAVKQNSRGCVYWLCRLPGLQQTDSAALESLIEAALLNPSFAVAACLLQLLLRLPAAIPPWSNCLTQL